MPPPERPPSRSSSRRHHLTLPPDWDEKPVDDRLRELWWLLSAARQDIDHLKGLMLGIKQGSLIWREGFNRRLQELAEAVRRVQAVIDSLPEDFARILGELGRSATHQAGTAKKLDEHSEELKRHKRALALRRLTLLACMAMAPSLKDIFAFGLRKVGIHIP